MAKKTATKVPDAQALQDAMIDAAHASGKVLMKYFGSKKLIVREKDKSSLVTQADTEAEEAAMKILSKARRDFRMLTEESSPIDRKARGRWIIDPLDGTTNFVHRFPMFCVSLAAEWEGQIIAGVIFHPVLGDMYTTIRGQGAYVNGTRMRVSKTRTLRDSLLSTGFTYRKDEWLHAEMEAFERLSSVARAIRRPGSAALDLAYTARGVFDGFWERRLAPWDVAAGALMVEEAGGKVTDFNGKPYRINGREILATNKALHVELRKAVGPESCPL